MLSPIEPMRLVISAIEIVERVLAQAAGAGDQRVDACAAQAPGELGQRVVGPDVRALLDADTAQRAALGPLTRRGQAS